MKKLSKLVSMVLTMTMLCSAMLCIQPAPVSAATGDVLLDVDFDSTTPEVVGQAAGTSTVVNFTVTSDEDGEGNYVSVEKTAWNGSGYEFSKKTDGSFTIEFDFNIENTENKERYFMILPSKTENSADKGTVILSAKNGNLYFGPVSGDKIGDGYIANTWYTYKAYVNTTTGYCAVDVCKKADGTYFGGYNGVLDEKVSATPYLGMVKNIEYGMFGLVGDGFNGTKLDNIKITDEDTYLFRSDFKTMPTMAGDDATMTEGTETDGNTYLNFVKTTWNTTGFAYGANADRTFNVEFDFNFDDAEKGNRYFVLAPGATDNSVTPSLILLSTTASGDICFACETGSKARPMGTIADDTWYTYKAYINMDTGYCVVNVYQRDTGTVIGGFNGTVSEKGTANYTGIVLGKDYGMFGILADKHTGTKVDNILISDAEEKKDEYMLYADYDNYSTEIGVGSVTGAAIVDESGNKVLSTDNQKEWNKTWHNFKTVSDGRMRVKFDVKRENDGEWYVMLAPDSNLATTGFLVLIGMNSDGQIKFAEHSSKNTRPLGTLVSGSWYTYEAIIDIDTGYCEAKVTNKTTGLLEGSFAGTVELKSTENASYTGFPVEGTTFSCLAAQGALVGGKIDNLSIEKYYAPPAAPSADTVTLKDAAGTVQSDAMAVSPLTKTVAVDFATAMDAATVTNDTVFVSAEGGTTALDGSNVTLDGSVATITLPTLAKSTKYTLHVTTGAATQQDKTLDTEATYDFMTGVGEFSVTMTNTAPGTYAALKGTEVVIPCSYTNSTLEAKTVEFIVAYYDANNMLKYAALAEASFTEEQTIGTYEFKHTVLDLDDVTNVKIMAWESLKSLKPLSDYAWVINYTNPMALCIKALYTTFPEIKAFGCCHEVFGTQKLLARGLSEICGIDNVDRKEIKVNVVGLNHFTWLTKAEYRDTDLFDVYKKLIDKHNNGGVEGTIDTTDKNWMNKSFTSCELVKMDLFSRYGYIAAAGDRHLAEFCEGNWYLENPDKVKEMGFALTTVDWRIEDLNNRLARSARLLSGEEEVKIEETGEEGVMQMRALLGLCDLVTNVNIPNVGQIPNLPMGAVVETNAAFKANSLVPVMAGNIPEEIYPLVSRIAGEQEIVARACRERNLELAFKAFANDQLVPLNLSDARKLFDEMVENTKEYLGEYYE